MGSSCCGSHCIGVCGGIAVYQGQFENDKMHGDGKYMYKSGKVYEGQFVRNMMEGSTAISLRAFLRGAVLCNAGICDLTDARNDLFLRCPGRHGHLYVLRWLQVYWRLV